MRPAEAAETLEACPLEAWQPAQLLQLFPEAMARWLHEAPPPRAYWGLHGPGPLQSEGKKRGPPKYVCPHGGSCLELCAVCCVLLMLSFPVFCPGLLRICNHFLDLQQSHHHQQQPQQPQQPQQQDTLVLDRDALLREAKLQIAKYILRVGSIYVNMLLPDVLPRGSNPAFLARPSSWKDPIIHKAYSPRLSVK